MIRVYSTPAGAELQAREHEIGAYRRVSDADSCAWQEYRRLDGGAAGEIPVTIQAVSDRTGYVHAEYVAYTARA